MSSIFWKFTTTHFFLYKSTNDVYNNNSVLSLTVIFGAASGIAIAVYWYWSRNHVCGINELDDGTKRCEENRCLITLFHRQFSFALLFRDSSSAAASSSEEQWQKCKTENCFILFHKIRAGQHKCIVYTRIVAKLFVFSFLFSSFHACRYPAWNIAFFDNEKKKTHTYTSQNDDIENSNSYYVVCMYI